MRGYSPLPAGGRLVRGVLLTPPGVAASHGIALDPTLIAGSPRWCGTPDDDARKMLALILGGVRDALRNDTDQERMADVSKGRGGSRRLAREVARSIQQPPRRLHTTEGQLERV